MEYVWEIVLTVLCLMGLGLLVWCLMGRLVCPVPGAGGPGRPGGAGGRRGAEQSVRALMWLRSLGLLRCPVVIVDLGLDREGLAVAQRLALRWPVVDLYRPEMGRRRIDTREEVPKIGGRQRAGTGGGHRGLFDLSE